MNDFTEIFDDVPFCHTELKLLNGKLLSSKTMKFIPITCLLFNVSFLLPSCSYKILNVLFELNVDCKPGSIFWHFPVCHEMGCTSAHAFMMSFDYYVMCSYTIF